MKTLSLCMIAKNEERFIARAIESVKDIVDEVIVVDTGSSDRTKEVVKAAYPDVHLYDFTWCDDFALAKNFAIRKATCEWILVLDADELLEPTDAEQIKQLIQDTPYVAFGFISRHYTKEKMHAGWHALVPSERKPFMEGFMGYYDVRSITRLFMNDPHIYFQGRVHEDVNPSIFAYDARVGNKKGKILSLSIHHLHLSKEGSYIGQKQRYYYELSKKKLAEQPDSKIAFDVAVGCMLYDHDLFGSLRYLMQVLELDHASSSLCSEVLTHIDARASLPALRLLFDHLNYTVHDTNSLLNLGKAYVRTKHYKEALVVLKRLYDRNPQNTVLLEYLGITLSSLGKLQEASLVFERAFELEEQERKKLHFAFNVGALCEKTKEYRKAVQWFERALGLGFVPQEKLRERIDLLRALR